MSQLLDGFSIFMGSLFVRMIISLAVIAWFAVSSHGQTGCAAVNKDRPLLFVTYERVTDGKVFLALRNNTSCAIYVRSNGGPTLYRIINTVDGKTRLEKRAENTGFDLSDAEVLGDLIFEMRDGQNDRLISTTADGDSFFSRRIPPSVIIYFTVRRSSFASRLNLVVPFRYEWEEDAVPVVSGSAMHGVYFAIPGSLSKRERK
jgi:hypothetical protein